MGNLLSKEPSWLNKETSVNEKQLDAGADDAQVQNAITYISKLNTPQRLLVLRAVAMGFPADVAESLETIRTDSLLALLRDRGGWAGPLGEAGLLCCRKGADYDADKQQSKPEMISKDGYFPLGLPSYAQMLHVKSQRLLSLAVKKGTPENESARDTCLDMINYAAFAADWLARQVKP